MRFICRYVMAASCVLVFLGSAQAQLASSGGKDPTVGLLPAASDGYANWSVAGLNAIPLTGSISGTTLTVRYSPSQALGPGQTINGAGVASGTQITAIGTSTGGAGTYTVNHSQTVAKEAMTASGIPNRTKIYTTLAPSGGDDTKRIQNAMNACPPGQVVMLTTGVFKINAPGLVLSNTSCTLRGSGPGQQLNTGLNKVNGGGTVRRCASGSTLVTLGDASYCTDSRATQIIDQDRATVGNHDLLDVWANGTTADKTYHLASDAVQGTYSVTLTTAPSPAIQPGDTVWVSEDSKNDPSLYYGANFLADVKDERWYFTCPAEGEWPGQAWHNLCQILEVASTSNGGKTITFDTSITYPFHTAYTAELVTYRNQPLHGAGIENLFIWGGTNNGDIAIDNCNYCWVKNVEVAWGGMGLTETFRNVVRDSFIHEIGDPNPGGGGYIFTINTGASENLVENNVLWYGNKVDVMRVTGGGNVFGYNYADDAFGSGYPDAPEAGLNAGHQVGSHLEMFEGNYSHNFKGDDYWGGSIHITAFRNQFSAHRAAHPPLNTYVSPGNNCPYGDYDGGARAAVDLQAGSYYNEFVGNVLGMSSQVLYGVTTCDAAQTAFLVQVTTSSQYNAAQNANDVPMWQIGYEQAGDGSFVGTSINTITRTANWDWYSRAMHCYGTGGRTDLGCSGVTIPNSFYLTAKPAFFGSNPWPWVDPTTGATYTLPAKYCFEHGKMPTCLE